jgi:hypothetical protein
LHTYYSCQICMHKPQLIWNAMAIFINNIPNSHIYPNTWQRMSCWGQCFYSASSTLQVKIRFGSHKCTKCVHCNVHCDVHCRIILKPRDPNIRGMRAFVDGCHNIRWFFMEAVMLEHMSSLADWHHSSACPWTEQARWVRS